MRIPHIINGNTLLEYHPSPESLDLIGEEERKVVSENFEWNKDHCPPLTDYCVESISKHYERNPLLEELPCVDRDYLLEILSTNLPLELTIPLIDYDFYWQRRYKEKFGLVTTRRPVGWTWKSLYLERHVQEIIEQAQPQYNDEETFDDILNLCWPYVKRVIVTQLQCWKPPLTMEKEEIPEVFPIDHINFSFIFRKLPLVDEVDLIYGMNNVSEDFSWNMFKLSVADCDKLGKALLELQDIQILRIHRSKLEYKHCQALMQHLVNNLTLVELDLSNCQIGDQGALCVAKVLEMLSTLKKLNLSNNFIGQIGAEGLGFAMLTPNCADLEVLNLRLNPLGREGAMGIMRALVRCTIPKELSMSGCLFDDDAPIKVSQMITMNDSLKKLDVSSNWFGEDGGEVLVEALQGNTSLEWLDVRDTDISPEQQQQIKKLLIRNRTGIFEDEQEAEEEEPDTEEVVIQETEYQNVEENAEQ